MLVLRNSNRQLPHQRHRQDLGNRNAIMDGMGRTRRLMLVISDIHLLYHEEVRSSNKRMLNSYQLLAFSHQQTTDC